MATESKNARRLREEKELDKLSAFGISFRHDNRGPVGKALDALTGTDDGYGTSRSAGARSAGADTQNEIFRKEGKTVGESATDPRVRQSMREAAAEERREARGMKQGGLVKGWGKARGARAAKQR